MSIPEHKNPERDRTAVAPYNFVPLPKTLQSFDAAPAQDQYHPDLLTGKLVCTLTTASPLYVRAAKTIDQFEKDQIPSEPFYGETHEDLKIPGSSLRGMLRTMIEIVSNSKIQPVTQKPLFFRTVEESSIGEAYGKRMTTGDPQKDGWHPLVKAGYMELRNGDYYIRPAVEISNTQYYRVEEDVAMGVIDNLRQMAVKKNERWGPNPNYKWFRCKVWFRPVKPKSHLPESPQFYAEVKDLKVGDKPDEKGWVRGYFIASGWVPSRKGKGKHLHWIIGLPVKDNAQLLLVDDEDIELYKENGGGLSQDIKKYNMSALPKKETAKKRIPCFYIEWTDRNGNSRLAFGHTAMFRLPYEQSPFQMIPEHLQGREPDFAETMFGAVDTERGSIAGRLFITDARFQGDAKNALMDLQVISTQALSSPKPTAFQHYLTQNKPDEPTALSHYDSSAKRETTLRGHKLYWHVGNTEAVKKRLGKAAKPRQKDGSEDPKDRNMFKPVKEGQTFLFDIHFENLRHEELGALLWVLDKASNPKYRLKIGMAKPYGLGSISITYCVQLDNRKNRYKKLFDGDRWNEGLKEPSAETDQDLEKSQEMFAQWLLQENTATIDQVDKVERIQHLLTMLTWEGRPDPDQTRYMELEEFAGRKDIRTGKKKKPYSQRPVLPFPTDVQKWIPKVAKADIQQPALSSGEETGTVKTVIESYGFIERDDGQGDIFFHHSELKNATNVSHGDRVRFTIGPGRKGPAANNVYLITK